ncbi:MAG: nuclear transport factor 2 family protein [Pseudomonadota bacterium]
MKAFHVLVLMLAAPLSSLAACLPVADLIVRDAQYEEATRIGDAAFLQDYLADDFVWVHSLASAIESKAVVVERARHPPTIPKSRSTSEVHGHVFGDTVVLRGLSSVDAWNADGKTWRTSRYAFMRTYVNGAGGCKLLAAQTMKVWSSEAAAKAAP